MDSGFRKIEVEGNWFLVPLSLIPLKVFCETVTDGNGEDTLEPWSFKVAYDKLVIAAGAEALTFGIRGVKEHAIFLREVHHAQEIRRRLLLNLMLSDVPGMLPFPTLPCKFRHHSLTRN